MRRWFLLCCCAFSLMLAALLPTAPAPAHAHATAPLAPKLVRAAPPDLPAVDPNYIYNQLDDLATRFQGREAGYDTNVAPLVNGHDEFATYWASEMQKNLAGFGATVTRDSFAISGWPGRPAVAPAVNVEVTVPGLAHPEQVVLIGCHYDGEADSTQSANDDASGCVIELGIAQAMGTYWRAHAVYPARTLRFVLYDAEEQGIFGSFHAVNTTVNGDLSNIVAMFNEEQSGIGYPLRFLGDIANPTLPMYAFVSPLHNSDIYPNQDALSPDQRAAITTFRALLAQAIPAVFAEFHALGYTSLAYHDANGRSIGQPIFMADQTGSVQLADDTVAASDEFPFTLAGLPCATFSGNFTYYDPGTPPPWSYPYDQPQDTIQLMNTYANDTAEKAPALALALALPGMLTSWMLAQPQILGTAVADGKPIAAISDVGAASPGKPLALDASASYDPAGASPLSYAWSFGDGATATGVSVTHTYTAAGAYSLTLTVTSATGSRRIVKPLTVTSSPPAIINPFGAYHPTGYPRPNTNVILPTPNPALAQAQAPPASSRSPGSSSGAGVHTAQVYVLL
ncbi:MAG: M28 family peptidase, partial [Ktedonobacterales bacterium]